MKSLKTMDFRILSDDISVDRLPKIKPHSDFD